MTRRFVAFAVVLFCAATLAAQAVHVSPHEGTVLQTRTAPPPPSNASAEELESAADQMRADKNYLDALEYYRTALMVTPHPAVIYNKMGISEIQLMRLSDARKDFERALKVDKRYSEAMNNLGVVYYIDRKYGKAIKYYRKALILANSSASFHSNLGTAYFSKKEYDKAAVEYAKAMQLDPDIFERNSRDGVAARMGTPEDRARYDYVLAAMYSQSGNYDRGLQYLKKAMEEGYPDINRVFKDREFAGLRKDKRFVELMARRPQPITN